MASKKLILGIIGVAAVGYYFYDKNKNNKTDSKTTATGEPVWLTDQQAIQYGINNPGVKSYFNGDLEKMKTHWFQTGYGEGRSFSVGGHIQ